MSIKRTAIAGAVFGITAVGGATFVIATQRSAGDPTLDEAAFSSETLHIFAAQAAAELPPDTDEVIAKELEGAAVRYAGEASEVAVYLAERPDGSICLLVFDPVGTGMTCGTMEQVANGDLNLVSQLSSRNPVMFVGVAANDVTAATIGDGVAAEMLPNAWVALGDAL